MTVQITLDFIVTLHKFHHDHVEFLEHVLKKIFDYFNKCANFHINVRIVATIEK